MPESILIVSFSSLHRDPRVQRQIEALHDDYYLTTAGFTKSPFDDVAHIPLIPPNGNLLTMSRQALRLKLGDFESYYWQAPHIQHAERVLDQRPFHLILANDLLSLPLCLRLAGACGARLLFDAHEYEPGQHSDSWYFRFFFQDFWSHVARTYLRQADHMLTVSDGIAAAYHEHFGAQAEVMTNATSYVALEPSATDAARIRMIHHGSSSPTRRLGHMLDLMERLDDRFHLDLMLVPDHASNHAKLARRAANMPNVRMRDPVALDAIVHTLNAYDLGLYLLAPESFNCRMALPNKLFEFVQARLGIAIWPSPEMARIVQKHELGVVGTDFSIESMASQLNALDTDAVRHFKARSHAAAHALSADSNRSRLQVLVRELLNG